MALPHHDGSEWYVEDPEPALGDVVPVWLRAPADTQEVRVRCTPDAEPVTIPATRDDQRRPASPGEQWWRAEVPVRNPVTRYRFELRSPRGGYWLNARGVADHEVPDTYDFRLLAEAPPPAWATDSIVYEIFPDRFARSAASAHRPVPDWAIPCGWEEPVIGQGPETPLQLYGGDLDGVTERLDHIAGLGATAVYLTPFFPAASNHRYNAGDFEHVDPVLGGDAALSRLAQALHGRGMRLIGDLTTNHCGDTHQWFVEALAAEPGAAARELFYFDRMGDDYESWLGHRTLPKLNWGDPELRRRFLDGPESIVARWLEHLDGWRVDVANMTGRVRDVDLTHQVARSLRASVLAARPDGLLVAEHGHDFTGDLDRGGWHGTMNYAGFTRPLWSWLRADQMDLYPDGVEPEPRAGRAVAATMRAFAGLVSWRSLTASWTMLSSHDTARIRTICGDRSRVEVAVGLMMTYPGTPMIFAGDEIGLTGRNGEESRVPMPWAHQPTWDTATLAAHRRLASLRATWPALRTGGLRWVHASEDTLAFLRETDRETLLVCARRAAGPPAVARGLPITSRRPVNLYGGADLPTTAGTCLLPADGPTFQVWRL